MLTFINNLNTEFRVSQRLKTTEISASATDDFQCPTELSSDEKFALTLLRARRRRALRRPARRRRARRVSYCARHGLASAQASKNARSATAAPGQLARARRIAHYAR